MNRRQAPSAPSAWLLEAEDLDHPPPRHARKLERLHEARDEGGDLARGEALLDGPGQQPDAALRETLVEVFEDRDRLAEGQAVDQEHRHLGAGMDAAKRIRGLLRPQQVDGAVLDLDALQAEADPHALRRSRAPVP